MKHLFLTLALLFTINFAFSQVRMVTKGTLVFVEFILDASECNFKEGVINGQQFQCQTLNFIPVKVPKSGIIIGEVSFFHCNKVLPFYHNFKFKVPKRILKQLYPNEDYSK